jgi:hypothetical protein
MVFMIYLATVLHSVWILGFVPQVSQPFFFVLANDLYWVDGYLGLEVRVYLFTTYMLRLWIV